MFSELKIKIKRYLKSKLLSILHVDDSINIHEGAIIVGENKNNIILGKNVKFGGNVYLHADAPISIGDNTIIAYNCTIHTSTHDYNEHPMWLKRIDRPIKIGKHVWIGTGAIIIGGIIIEDYAVVAAGSLITKNIPKGAIVGGNPAKIIKFRIPESFNRMPSIDEPQNAAIIKKGYSSKYYS